MSRSLRTEFYKYRVPLSQVWEEVTDLLVGWPEQAEVENLVMERLVLVSDQIHTPTELAAESADDTVTMNLARSLAIASVQSRFSGSIPSLPDRETDILTQHYLICSLVGKVLLKGVSASFSTWWLSHSHQILSTSSGPRSKDILNALTCFKGMVGDDILSLCESFLSEKDLALPSITLITKKSHRFKQIMSAPDMVTDGDKSLPRLLTKMTNDKEFRQVFVWLPLDAGIPSNKADFRYVLSLIVKILFGKLSQRGGGIDKRSSFAERQNQIMAYIGTVPREDMDVVFSVFFAKVCDTPSSQFNETVLRSNPKLCLGLLSVMQKMISQMKRNIDPYVEILASLVVRILLIYVEPNVVAEEDRAEDVVEDALGDTFAEEDTLAEEALEDASEEALAEKTDDESSESGDSEIDHLEAKETAWNRQITKLSLLRLKEMMNVYYMLPCWSSVLLPIIRILQMHLLRSSCVEVSTVFQMVTNWANHDELVPLYETFPQLTETFFSPRAYLGRPASLFFGSILTLCGEEKDEKKSGQNYSQSRKKLIRELKWNDIDSDDDMDVGKIEIDEKKKNQKIIFIHIENILKTVSLSLAKTSISDVHMHLKVTMAIAKLDSSSTSSCVSLLSLLGNLIAPLTRRKTKQSSVELFGAIEAISLKLGSEVEIPPLVLVQVERPILTLDDVLGRFVLARSVLSLVRSDADLKIAKYLVDLNSVKSNAVSVQPDVDKHIDVLQELVDDADHFAVQHGSLIRHCLFLISSSACDSTVRHLAEKYLCLQRIASDNSPGLLLMILNTVHHLLESAELGPFRSGLKVLLFFVQNHSPKFEDETNIRLFHQDLLPYVEDMQELLHIQKQKRTRAFKKLIEQPISVYTKQKLFIPIAMEMIGQTDTAKSNYDQGMSDVGIAAICVCPNQIQILLTLIKNLLRKNPEREKFIFKAVGKVTEYIRVNNIDFDLAKINAVLIPQLKRRIWDAKGNLKQGQPGEGPKKRDENTDGMVKLDIVVALLEVLKLLPLAEFEAAMPQIVSLICRGLPSREILCRKAARESLRRCATIIGAHKLAWLLKQIRLAVPKGGYQASVAVFTAHAVLEAVDQDVSLVKTSIEIAEEVLEFIRIEDRQWASLQSRSANDLGEEAVLTKQCLEAGRMRGHELAELAGKKLAPEIVTCVLLQSVYGLFTSLDIDIEVSDIEPEEKLGVKLAGPVGAKRMKKFLRKDSSCEDSSDDETHKRKISKISSGKKDVQLNSCFGKKFFTRIEGAISSIISGLMDNSRFTDDMKLGVSLQSFAVFNDFLSHRFSLDNPFESDLFTSVAIPSRVFEIDHELVEEVKEVFVEKKSRAEILKENTFMVQPGASTGKGHWVTEEWKRGKMAHNSQSTTDIGFAIRTAKMKLLATLALRIVNQLNESMDVDLAVGKLLGKFLTRSLCSGISELFQLSAKGIGKIVSNKNSFFNEKAMGLILKKLISSFEQMHANGSDLSFITMKSQKKIQASELAATCSGLLLTLTEDSSSWLKPDMLEALAAHVLSSLDNSGLQWSSLLILRKVLLTRKSFAAKSATVYSCLNKVGELVTTASSEKVAAVSGTMYGRFLVEFAHSEKSLIAKVTMLLKQAQSGSILSRKTALNTIFSFVKALTGRQVQDQFGELIVVTLSVRIASEEDKDAANMIVEIVELCLEKFLDEKRRLAVCTTISEWAEKMTKWQFVFSSMEISSRVFAHHDGWSKNSVQIIDSVVRQLPFLSEQGGGVETRGLVGIVRAVDSLTRTGAPELGRLVEYVAGELLNNRTADPLVTGEALKLVFSLSQRPETAKIFFVESSDLIAPWPLMMRVLHVLCSDTVESHLDLASVAMKTVANLLPLTYQELEFGKSVEDVENPSEEMGIFKSSESCPLDDELTTSVPRCEFDRLAALLKKIRYDVRKLMGRSRDSIIRLASLLKLTAALTLGCVATSESEILSISLEILIRLATINKTAEEVSIEMEKKKVNSLFDLSILRPIEQIGYLSKMSNTALETIERHYTSANLAGFFTKQLTSVTTTINADRKIRKISLMNLAISNPQRMAMLRLQKSKKKSIKSQANKKESIKRIKGMIH